MVCFLWFVLDGNNIERYGQITTQDMPNVAFPTRDDLEQFSQIKEYILEVPSTSNRCHTQLGLRAAKHNGRIGGLLLDLKEKDLLIAKSLLQDSNITAYIPRP